MSQIIENALTLHSYAIMAGRLVNGGIYNALTETSTSKARVLSLPASIAEVLVSSLSKLIGSFELAGYAISHIVQSPFKQDKSVRMGLIYLTASLNALVALAVTLLLSPVAIVLQTATVLHNPKEAVTFERQALLAQAFIHEPPKRHQEENARKMLKALSGV
jgi:hypothetical protein